MADTHRDTGRRTGRARTQKSGSNVVALGLPDRSLVLDPSPLTLAQLIEGEIIPRLLMAHRDGSDPDVISMTTGVIDAAELDRFSRLILTSDLGTLTEHVDLLTRRGVGMQTIYFDLLSPAAKRLGEMWESDECSFTDVTDRPLPAPTDRL